MHARPLSHRRSSDRANKRDSTPMLPHCALVIINIGEVALGVVFLAVFFASQNSRFTVDENLVIKNFESACFSAKNAVGRVTVTIFFFFFVL